MVLKLIECFIEKPYTEKVLHPVPDNFLIKVNNTPKQQLHD